MKIDFGKVLKTLTNEDIQEMGLESAILKKASGLVPQSQSWTLAIAGEVLDAKGVKLGDILASRGMPFTLGALCADVLVSRVEPGEEGVDGQHLVRRYKLAIRVFTPNEKGPISISSEEVVLLRRLIVKAKEKYTVLVTGQALAMLEDSEE